ncbi:MAG: HNH endonuclease [Sphaerochaeta sp.]|jgi:5-methylcytosine-specific restriction endonuclease McrA|nr:HNH endonuclease [Sphaerochaeta sp.]
MAKWRSENICQERAYQWKGGVIAAQKRFRSNPKARVNARMASAMGASLKGNKRGRSWEKLAGYTCDQLIKHLKGTMPEGYSWSDFMGGDLEIDHVIPQAVFNFSSPSHIDFKRCWDIKNLQLLPARKNRQKGARIDAPFQPSLALQVPI